MFGLPKSLIKFLNSEGTNIREALIQFQMEK